ncbi:hypothetical protein BKD09_33790 [Bradyrhizobium japonicum]|uniref:Uncharacterized protein n=1 Tax=Bradyrhizobium japonicum TaxID=375 RepID=A0A1L3FJ67_BRAJP|nr:hypothetical protein BKD09_33790 [Bradyrhizobium japonicum]
MAEVLKQAAHTLAQPPGAGLRGARLLQTRGFLFLALTLIISLTIVHGSLWVRGIRPSPRTSLWEHLIWEVLPRDDQQRQYLKQRFFTMIVVLPVVAFAVHALLEKLAG